jgi:hypothetical protein
MPAGQTRPAQFERGSFDEQRLLEAASVAGREFVASVLASGLGWTEADVAISIQADIRHATEIHRLVRATTDQLGP